MNKPFSFFLIFVILILVSCNSSRVITTDISEPLKLLYDARPEDCPELIEIDETWNNFQKIQTIAINCAHYKLWGETWKDYAERLEQFNASLTDILNK